ncbi:aldehyde dehydrogenase family protein [Aestuariivirga litoralis]|uniref:aldehyde dehydrogenase family protein n=1 Tax=Aestuariivirga litoralis TaxID=2650924 RepID=UPI0018C764E3|nr:aldehyde dehydrogenase family protein [Aestuariivirga litoralis]MBG1232438.1 aldehyde dehydrogenase family protein [Aestuariivirga litoralis]
MTTVNDVLESMDYGPAPESNSHVKEWLAAHAKGFGHFVNGAFTASKGKTIEVFNPANMEKLASTANGSAADVDVAVAAARKAFKGWSALSGFERGKHLYALARHIQKRERFLAVLETMDNGKTIRESRDIDIPLVARHFYHHAGWAQLIDTEFKGYGPLGVCGQIIPWNFPLLMLAWKIAPALAAGNTVVLKPAEFTPLTALAFAEICSEAGLPPGVVNIVTGDGETGAALSAHKDVNKIAFTGSTEVGKIIRKQTAGSGKKLSLELGGKSPFIVFDDADLDAAVEGVVDAVWFNQGQVCCAGTRLLVQESVYDPFIKRLRKRMESLRVGDPLDKSNDMGPLVDPVQLARVTELVNKGRAEGGTLVSAPCPIPEKGNYFAPSLFLDVDTSSTVMSEEIFGPVISAMSFRTADEAAMLANHTRYGLAASIWSENINVALEAGARMKAGVVWINCTNNFDAAAGFGGYKESGFGREGGREGLYEYLIADWIKNAPAAKAEKAIALSAITAPAQAASSGIDRTSKLYIGGKQARPDSGYSYSVTNAKGKVIGQAGLGNRKDVRNAVEAAIKATGWSSASAHNRAQVLYFIAENLGARADEFAKRLVEGGASARDAKREVDASLQRIFYYAAQADKYDGRIHSTNAKRQTTLAFNEPYGVVGLVCPTEAPLLSMISLAMPALAMGNRIVLVPSQAQPLVVTDFYQVLDTSDVPDGAFNIITGARDELAKTMADHDEIAALWYHGDAAGSAAVEKASAGNLKPTWVSNGTRTDWYDAGQAQGAEYLRRATQVKNIWIPYGE